MEFKHKYFMTLNNFTFSRELKYFFLHVKKKNTVNKSEYDTRYPN